MQETLVIDDLIPEPDQHSIHNIIMSQAEWKFLPDVSGVDGHTWPSHGFVHILKDPRDGYQSNMFTKQDVCGMILKEIGKYVDFEDVYYARSFLQLPLPEQYRKEHNGIHVDLPKEIKHVACVYYVNSSDGDTVIYDQTINDVPGGSQGIHLTEHKRVNPKRGRLVIFDGSRYHCSSQPTVNYRCIINFDLRIK